MLSVLPRNFGALEPEYSNFSDSRIVILPVAFDKTSSWQRGSRKGPRAIIRASRHMELYDMDTNSELFRQGIFTAGTFSAANSIILKRRIFNHVSRFLGQRKFVVTLGGDHSVSVGAHEAHLEYYPDLSVLHLDAHADLRDSYEGNPLSHACSIARIREKTKNVVSVGIRSMDSSELESAKAVFMLGMQDILHDPNWIHKAVERLTDPVYVTIDVDVFDSGIMPSTGTPEPGGLAWDQVTGLLRRVAEQRKVIGFDVVELSPSKNKAPDFLAAKLIYKFLSYIFHATVPPQEHRNDAREPRTR